VNERKLPIVIHGVSTVDEVPGIETVLSDISVRCAPNLKALRDALPGASVLLGWKFDATELHDAWDCVDQLRWIQWPGAGVDAILCPFLVESDIVLTNMHGVFDRAIAEYVLGLMLAFSKGLPETCYAQKERRWAYRLTERLEGCQVLVVGVGGIGRAIARMLGAVGCHVQGVGRSARSGDSDFVAIYASEDLDQVLADADYVVAAAPLTEKTRGLFGAKQFATMKQSARFINVGRGASVIETALVEALQKKQIAGAALDVFETEPLPPNSPLWDFENVVVSPHMSGDYDGHHATVVQVFLDNLSRFKSGEPLLNQVDKRLGFVTT
jgi:phosphoglycerate dehydrogenase-like enzyme